MGDLWSVECADAIEWLGRQDDDSIDLLVTSPPYERARTYGISKALPAGQDWVDWMVRVVTAAAPKVKGLIAINCEGQTRGYKYSAVPFLLMADLHRAGFNLRKPLVFHRVGIPGSGGPDWFRNDWEPIICVTREGKLPWSDNTACGHPPKWAPGGEMAHRVSDGTRINQRGKMGSMTGTTATGNKEKPAIGKPRPSHQNLRGDARREAVAAGRGRKMSLYDSGAHADSTKRTEWNSLPPAIANPGNVIDQTYTAAEVAAFMGELNDVIKCNVGGGAMGHDLAHENEAPYPIELPTFLVKSCCPPGGVVGDTFVGSGTTCQAAVENGRRFRGCDVRQSQVDLTRKRMRTITMPLFAV